MCLMRKVLGSNQPRLNETKLYGERKLPIESVVAKIVAVWGLRTIAIPPP